MQRSTLKRQGDNDTFDEGSPLKRRRTEVVKVEVEIELGYRLFFGITFIMLLILFLNKLI